MPHREEMDGFDMHGIPKYFSAYMALSNLDKSYGPSYGRPMYVVTQELAVMGKAATIRIFVGVELEP